MSSDTVIALALVSSMSRAILNVIDRRLFSTLKSSYFRLNLLNNVLSLMPLIAVSVASEGCGNLIQLTFDPIIFLFALSIQLVAYAFTYAFRFHSVHIVLVFAKVSDLFIPLSIWAVTGYWASEDFRFAVFTSIGVIPVLVGIKSRSSGNYWALFLIVVSLTIQGGVSSIVSMPMSEGSFGAFSIAAAIVFWRTVISFLVTKQKRLGVETAIPRDCVPKLLLRGLFSFVTQVTFIAAVVDVDSIVAWPILNSALLFSVVLSSLILREHGRLLEWVSVIIIMGVIVFQYIDNP